MSVGVPQFPLMPDRRPKESGHIARHQFLDIFLNLPHVTSHLEMGIAVPTWRGGQSGSILPHALRFPRQLGRFDPVSHGAVETRARTGSRILRSEPTDYQPPCTVASLTRVPSVLRSRL